MNDENEYEYEYITESAQYGEIEFEGKSYAVTDGSDYIGKNGEIYLYETYVMDLKGNMYKALQTFGKSGENIIFELTPLDYKAPKHPSRG